MELAHSTVPEPNVKEDQEEAANDEDITIAVIEIDVDDN